MVFKKGTNLLVPIIEWRAFVFVINKDSHMWEPVVLHFLKLFVLMTFWLEIFNELLEMFIELHK